MPVATPYAGETTTQCQHCGTAVYPRYPARLVGEWWKRPTWHHHYQGWALGQMTCDPQLARAAKQERQPDHAPA